MQLFHAFPAKKSRWPQLKIMPCLWLRSHRWRVTHDIFSLFLDVSSFQDHLIQTLYFIISHLPTIFCSYKTSIPRFSENFFYSTSSKSACASKFQTLFQTFPLLQLNQDSAERENPWVSAARIRWSRWSFGVLVYVILVGQFPIGQSRQTKSELTRNIIKVEKAMAEMAMFSGDLMVIHGISFGFNDVLMRLHGGSWDFRVFWQDFVVISCHLMWAGH